MNFIPHEPIENTAYVFVRLHKITKHAHPCGVFLCTSCGNERILALHSVRNPTYRPRSCRSCANSERWRNGAMGGTPIQQLWQGLTPVQLKLATKLLAMRRTDEGEPIPASAISRDDCFEAIRVAAACDDPEAELKALHPRFRMELSRNFAHVYYNKFGDER